LLCQQHCNYCISHRAKVIEGFIRSAGAAIKSRRENSLTKFGKYVSEVYFYTDKSLRNYIDAINKALSGEFEINTKDAADNLEKLSKELVLFPVRTSHKRKHRSCILKNRKKKISSSRKSNRDKKENQTNKN